MDTASPGTTKCVSPQFSFMLPSEMIEVRKAKFEGKFNICNSLRYYYGL